MTRTITLSDFHMPTYRRWPIEIVSGRGCRVDDADGKSYLDFTAGIAVASLGHAHPALTEAVATQAAKLVHVSNLYATGPQSELSERLGGLTNGMYSFFTNSGSEAVECALKLARKHARINRGIEDPVVVAAKGGFHGRTMGALAATGQPAKQAPFAPLPVGFVHVPYGDAAAIQQAVGPSTAAVILEPVQGEAGVIVPPDGYLAEVADICTAAGCLLIADEVQTGMGRTGEWFACDHDDVRPDVLCLAKGLGGGFPIGACLATQGVASTFVPGDHGSTFGGGPVQCAAALAVIDTIENELLLERAQYVGDSIIAQLRGMQSVTGEVRGKGLLIGIDCDKTPSREIAGRCLEQGLLINDVTPSTIRLSPPLTITDDEVDEGLAILEAVFDEI